MQRLLLATIVVLAGVAVSDVNGLASCDSALRYFPQYESFFAHCNCLHEDWTEWRAVNRTRNSNCASGSALIYKRVKTLIQGQCSDIVEHESICEPDISDRIIIALGLGSSPSPRVNLPTDPLAGRPGPPNCRRRRLAPARQQTTDPAITDSPGAGLCSSPPTPPSPIGSPHSGPPGGRPLGRLRQQRQSDQICHHVTRPHSRRSVRDEFRGPRLNSQNFKSTERGFLMEAKPFDIKEHGGRYRRSHRDHCTERHILFVLDTSGSILEAVFNNITTLLSNMTKTFCGNINVAAMTFNHEYFREFCFSGSRTKTEIVEAISSIRYHRPEQGSGTRWTHTSGAAQCVCDYMLHNEYCHAPIGGCIDVVFFTDGRANDPAPHNDVCGALRCLHERADVDTFAIGVGNFNNLQLGCYADNDLDLDEYHLFNFANFTALQNEFEIVFQKIFNDTISGGDYQCSRLSADPRNFV